MLILYLNTTTREWFDANGNPFGYEMPRLAFQAREEVAIFLKSATPGAGELGVNPLEWPTDIFIGEKENIGAKITVDSASLMNKGFEVIEAVRLFGVSPEQIKVVVHPQSIMHSAVEYIDNSIIAQMGAPDMRTCIQYAITYPERKIALAKELDFTSLSNLTFEEPDMDTFTLLALAFYAIKEDGIIPAVLNASDEIAVHAFLKDKIGFTNIFDVVEKVVMSFPNISDPTLEDIISADNEARVKTKELLNSIVK
jgi:1-deoxy-D-xylulose-5-phosphate reductoisomerase